MAEAEDKTTPDDMSKEEVDNVEEENRGYLLPNEIVSKILSYFDDRKQLVKARKVCRRWRDVVDNNFVFRVTVDDENVSIDHLQHLRVKSCVFTNFTKDVPQNIQLFQNPAQVSKLHIFGPITAENFKLMARQLGGLKQLYLNDDALSKESLVVATTPMEETELVQFWRSVTKLDMTNSVTCKETSAVEKNISQILGYQMPNLRTLVLFRHVCRHSPTLIKNVFTQLLCFLGQNQGIDNLQVYFSIPISADFQTFMDEQLRQVVGRIQLSKVMLKVQSHLFRGVMLPVLEQQNSLTDLRVKMTDGYPGVFMEDAYIFVHLEDTLLRNKDTLTIIEFSHFYLHANLDCAIFQGMSNLKRLLLDKHEYCVTNWGPRQNEPIITNLWMLPASIEILEVNKFKCGTWDLAMMAIELVKLKSVQFSGTGADEGLGLTQPILEALTQNNAGIQKILFSPVILSRFDVPQGRNMGNRQLTVNGYTINLNMWNGTRIARFDN